MKEINKKSEDNKQAGTIFTETPKNEIVMKT